MLATRLLVQQHDELRALFARHEGAAPNRKIDVFDEVARRLLAHMLIEQRYFYPAVVAAAVDDVHEGYEEHHLARHQIDRIVECAVSDETYEIKSRVLYEMITHHVEEEQVNVFPAVESAIDSAELEILGELMKTDFDRIVAFSIGRLMTAAGRIELLADVGAFAAPRVKSGGRGSATARPC